MNSRDLLAILSIVFIALNFNSVTIAKVRGQSREEKVLGDKLRFEKNGLWYYNDLESGFATAAKTKQPVFVVLRCLPCEECVKLDEELLDNNPRFQQLLKSFVRVRIVGTNGLDLSLFQFDTDQSFAVFVFGPDRTLYARYGTRSDRKAWEDDVSVDGLVASLEKSLALHQDYPSNRELLVDKQAKRPVFASPEKIPSLASRFTGKLDYDNNVVKSCIHCHMIGDGMREYYRAQDGRLPEEWLFPYPHPKIVGLILDPHQAATVKSVVIGSAAAQAGFLPGDELVALEGQAMTSMADVQWVLHNTPNAGGTLKASIVRADKSLTLSMKLDSKWRESDDIAWRASSWPLRRLGVGGIVSESATAEDREKLRIPKGKMALSIKHVGAFAPHDRAKKAGLQKGDIVISYDGRDDLDTETKLLSYALNEVPPGKKVTIRYVRGSEIREAIVATAE